MSAVPLIAQSWIDVTDVFIKNAHFLNNSTEGWEGDEFGFAGPMYNAEHYNKTFNTYQDLAGLTPGTYRLSLKGYYRAGEAGNDYEYFRFYGDDYRHAQLYATSSVNDYSTQLVYCSSAAQPSPSEVQPAVSTMTMARNGSFRTTWKQPTTGSRQDTTSMNSMTLS